MLCAQRNTPPNCFLDFLTNLDSDHAELILLKPTIKRIKSEENHFSNLPKNPIWFLMN